MGEKFASNPVTGTGSMTVPIAVSPGRGGFGPQLSLSYDSGAGNGPFGLGWNLSLPAITRKTDKGLPRYYDTHDQDSDVFILSGAEDLVPVLDENGRLPEPERRGDYQIKRYRPRIEGLFARIERWTHQRTGEIHWRSITKDNITTLYGKDNNSRIFDPADLDPVHPTRIFSWLICESYDDKGNAIRYEYKEENSDGVDLSQVNEKNRAATTRSDNRYLANRYLQRIKYCNQTPRIADEDLTQRRDWLMEVVFDYGEQELQNPTPEEIVRRTWDVREDAFSTYRSGFEVRTYRLCWRVLIFHHFPDDPPDTPQAQKRYDGLVRSTEFDYEPTPIASYLNKVTQSGCVRQPDNTYLKRSLPPVEFEYSQATIQDEVRPFVEDSLDNLPIGIDGSVYQWIDLDGDGVGGILTEQGDAWFYKRNLSPLTMRREPPGENGRDREQVIFNARFAPLETVAVQPSFKGITGGGMQFLDLAGDGRPDLAQFDGAAPGFFEHTEDDVWQPHSPFKSLPNVNWRDPNLKFVDLTGDGHADILISEDEVFTWYPSLAEDGFGASLRVRNPFDEEKGPRIVFADATQSISPADMSGDGLTDIVRIRNGEVCYWPNLGYGRFGAKVTMDGSPWFDHPDQFDQRRIRLADIDGSGVTDIIYLHGEGVRIYFNQSGNGWSAARTLAVFPQTDNLSAVTTTDLLSNGTACLVWSSPLPGHARRPMYYVDLMGGQKPHLMIKSRNNLGAETEVQYAPSTKFYLQDKYAGKPWITRLPFPVHVVERVITHDWISRNRFVTSYKYHHGYFDGVEREFRGFGMVEQRDTEEFAALSASGGRVSDAMLDAEGRYVHTEGDANWWIPSGRVFYSPDPTHTPPEELAYARRHFFLPHRFRDPFHTDAVRTESFVTYDQYKLLVQQTRDALDNRVTVGERHLDPTRPPVRLGHDYRVLQPALIMDPNRNCSEVAFDALGMVVGTAVMGDPEETPILGDRLTAAFRANLTQSEIDQFLADPKGPLAATLLAEATTRIVYDLTAWWREPDPAKKPPAVAATLARETHASEAMPAGGLKIQVSLSYSDGFGREMQKKIQAEPGPVPTRDDNGQIIIGADGQPRMTPDDFNPRWVGSGWTVFNNKGKPVRQYEPFFTDTHRFEFEVKIGVSPVLCYDPVERVVATLHPNHTWEKVVFDPWRQETWDVNDTALVTDPGTDADVGGFFRRLANADYLPTWHDLRTAAANATAFAERYPSLTARTNERRAAEKTRIHAATPTVAHADSLGRTFFTVAHNKFKYSDTPSDAPPVEDFYRTRLVLDIEGNQREVWDERRKPDYTLEQRIVMRYDYDMLGNRVRQASMEAGARWTLNDVAGKPLYAWDSMGHTFRTTYDRLRRPIDSCLREGTGAEIVVGRSIYGESRSNPEASNLRGKVVELRDQAGIVTSDQYDFKGNLLRSRRQLAELVDSEGTLTPAYKTTVNWDGVVQMQAESYTSRTRYDALNRPTQLIAPHSDQPGATVNVIQPIYNEANLLEQVHAWLNQDTEPAVRLDPDTANLHAVTNINYDAKGQRRLIDYGNGVRTTYTYDAVYRLIEATGREHLGQAGGAPIPHSHNDAPRVGILWSANDGNAMGRYLERYVYDAVGNFLSMQHRGSDPAHPGWTRGYEYNEASLIEPAKQSNRLTSTIIGVTTETYSRDCDGYDAHGNMLRMPHLLLMQWDYRDQLQATARQAVNNGTPETTWYVYDSSGQRVRKVTERMAAAGRTPTRMKERIYLGGFEVYREYETDGDTVKLERETLHIMDDKQRITLVETRTQGNDPSLQQLIRYQFGNHLGSASLELDDQAQIISYEEYTPYGSTSYQAVSSQIETPKRYRYTGMERDEETGLSYHTARYYASWLGRWVSCDPIGLEGGINSFLYTDASPVCLVDSNGKQNTGPRDAGVVAGVTQVPEVSPSPPPPPPPPPPPVEAIVVLFSGANFTVDSGTGVDEAHDETSTTRQIGEGIAEAVGRDRVRLHVVATP